MRVFNSQLNFFKDAGEVTRIWKIEDKKLKFLIVGNTMKVKISENSVEHSIPAYNIRGIPQDVLGNPSKYLASFLKNCYASICKLNDGYSVNILPMMLGGANIIKDEDEFLLWPDGIVPYALGNDLHPDYMANVRTAIQHWNDNTDFQFVRYDSNKHTDYLVIGEANSECYSYVGRQGGRQTIRCDLDDRDATGIKFDTGSLIHELGHAVGLYHEQSRRDRSEFVSVTARNAQYKIQGRSHGRYDFNSIMHYPLETGVMQLQRGVLSSPNVRLPEGGNLKNIGQRDALSFGDIAAANDLVRLSRGALTRASRIRSRSSQHDFQQRPAAAPSCCT